MLRYHQVSGQETLSPAVSACARFSVVLASPWKQHAGVCFWARTLQLQVRKGSPQTPPWPSMEGEECSLERDCHRCLRWHEPCIVLAGKLPEKEALASLFKEHAGRRGGEPKPGACSASAFSQCRGDPGCSCLLVPLPLLLQGRPSSVRVSPWINTIVRHRRLSCVNTAAGPSTLLFECCLCP